MKAAADISLAGGGAARNARSASEIAGFFAAVPKVRIHFPPAQSLRTIGSSAVDLIGAGLRLAAKRPNEAFRSRIVDPAIDQPGLA